MKNIKCILYLLIMCSLWHFINTEDMSSQTLANAIDGIYRQLDFLRTDNEIIKMRLGIIDLNTNKPPYELARIERKLLVIEESLAQLDCKLSSKHHDDDQEEKENAEMESLEDALIPQTTNANEIAAELQREDLKEQNKNFIKKVKKTEVDVPVGLLGDLPKLKEKEHCLEEIQLNSAETGQGLIIETKGNEEPLICLRDVEQKLKCSNITLPTSCTNSNSVNCFNSKCRIQNRLYGPASFVVPCDDNFEHGDGWTVIQRRINDSISFNRNWTEYKWGFGDLDGNYWIGLEKLYALTTTLGPMELLIQLQDHEGVKKYAKYDTFQIGDESTQYVLKSIGSYSGTSGDSFGRHKGKKFSTPDRDNDTSDIKHCAFLHKCGWWYLNCFYSNLNGVYMQPGVVNVNTNVTNGISWQSFHGYEYSMKFVQMLIRPHKI